MTFIIPAFFGNITAVFSFLAYKNFREQFRFKLYEERFEWVSELNIFCSVTVRLAGNLTLQKDNIRDTENLIEGFHKSAHNTFRGNGFLKGKFLFDNNIAADLTKLNDTYAFFTAFSGMVELSEENVSMWREKLDYIASFQTKIPVLFEDYIGFGHYKA